jgi:hypothetical protein
LFFIVFIFCFSGVGAMPRLAVLAITSRVNKNLEVVANAKFYGNPNKNPENAIFAKKSFWR